ncbi:hypothetical protein B0H19DRAFT_1257608 [Mycena capillaripes]|nr:hypothetical protein B0H19DRAFT_1257608 [Mycena capillaripes]
MRALCWLRLGSCTSRRLSFTYELRASRRLRRLRTSCQHHIPRFELRLAPATSQVGRLALTYFHTRAARLAPVSFQVVHHVARLALTFTRKLPPHIRAARLAPVSSKLRTLCQLASMRATRFALATSRVARLAPTLIQKHEPLAQSKEVGYCIITASRSLELVHRAAPRLAQNTTSEEETRYTFD